MPVFICSKCNMMDNTALSGYWAMQYLSGDDEEFKPLCSLCNPDIRRWHGEFERGPKPDDHVIGPDGFVYHKDDDYLKRLLKEKGKS